MGAHVSSGAVTTIRSHACLGCDSQFRHRRGLCSSCYNYAWARIRAGAITWAKLVALGQALSLRQPQREPLASEECIRGCGRFRKSRGLCHVCYNGTLFQVHRGETSWAAEEEAGRALEAVPNWLSSQRRAV